MDDSNSTSLTILRPSDVVIQDMKYLLRPGIPFFMNQNNKISSVAWQYIVSFYFLHFALSLIHQASFSISGFFSVRCIWFYFMVFLCLTVYLVGKVHFYKTNYIFFSKIRSVLCYSYIPKKYLFNDHITWLMFGLIRCHYFFFVFVNLGVMWRQKD